MTIEDIKTSSVILLAETDLKNRYLFGAYRDNGEATGFLELPEDHRQFVDLLTDEQTLMGRKTLDATPKDFPDAGRICVTHHPSTVDAPAIPASSIAEGIEIAKKRALKDEKKSIFVIGGASIIQQCLKEHRLDEIQLTLAYGYQKPVSNPVYLDFDLADWNIIQDSGKLTSTASKPPRLHYRFLGLSKK